MSTTPSQNAAAGGTWRVVPGALDLLASGELNEEEPHFDDFPAALPDSQFSSPTPAELAERWRSFVARLRNYRSRRSLVERTQMWLPMIDLHVPPEGHSVLKSQVDTTGRAAPCLKVFGVGLGAKLEYTLSETFEIEATGIAKRYLLNVEISADEWVADDQPPLRSINVTVPGDSLGSRLEDLPDDPEDPAVTGRWDPAAWLERGRIELSKASGPGVEKRHLRVARTSNWKVGLDLPKVLGLAGIDAGLSVEVERSDIFELTFELPYGHDYVLYRRLIETPLVPHCALVGRW